MSVLLQGLSMPKGNPRTINIYRDGVWCDAYTTENGKAIEAPTPHGRLLDADDVFHVLTSYYHHSTDFQREALKEALARVSTIIEAEDGGSDDQT